LIDIAVEYYKVIYFDLTIDDVCDHLKLRVLVVYFF
jgi:hypothetical protein